MINRPGYHGKDENRGGPGQRSTRARRGHQAAVKWRLSGVVMPECARGTSGAWRSLSHSRQPAFPGETQAGFNDGGVGGSRAPRASPARLKPGPGPRSYLAPRRAGCPWPGPSARAYRTRPPPYSSRPPWRAGLRGNARARGTRRGSRAPPGGRARAAACSRGAGLAA